MNTILDNVIERNINYDEDIFNAEKELLKKETPNNWNVHIENSMEKVLEVDFQEFAVSVVGETGQDLKETTAFTFYSTVGMLEKKFKPKKKR